ncbi:MAG TPA: serine/threonine-protein kinase [Candidatus Acidoferrum sp.]|nr:serine/threonine-protein kinase [Candidatus Acidoferrum sp.]
MNPAVQAGRYEILENLGRGATCRVDKARDTIIGRTVALKTFLQGFAKSSEQQLLTEAQTVGRLSHNSIAQLYDVGTDEAGAPYLVMEYVSGKTVAQLLSHSPIPWPKAAVWAADIASALSYAHRAGVIHGDVTPSNIRVTIDDHVKLVDFGVARFATEVSSADSVLGTPAYLSPEQIAGQKQDGRCDLFSLGVVLYEMLTGFRPFTGNSLGEVCSQILTAEPIPASKLNPAVPRAFDRILSRCLAKNPRDRYQTGNQLARALYLVARCRSKLGAQHARPFWMKRPVQPRDFLAVAAAVLLLVSVAVAETSLRQRSASQPSRARIVFAAPANQATPARARTREIPESAKQPKNIPSEGAPRSSQRPSKSPQPAQVREVTSTAAARAASPLP